MPRNSKNSPDDSLSPPNTDIGKPTYKSWKKKYRKQRIKFEEVMRQSNEYFIEEEKTRATAQRLREENDRLLDMLLDVNDCAQIPSDKRIDLSAYTPSLSTVPSIIGTEELAEASNTTHPAGRAICTEIMSHLEEQAIKKAISRPSESLAHLLSSTPHLNSESPLIAPDLLTSLEALEGHPAPLSYLTADQQDEHLSEIDASIGLTPPPAPKPHPTNSELLHKNPHSIYNWLRVHEPRVFLQDGEGSDKSTQKPGASRGAGKRASLPVPTRTDALEIVEEDGIGYEFNLGGKEALKNKRKRDDGDDESYHPKIGRVDSTKPKKRIRVRKGKAEGGSAETVSSTASAGGGGKGPATPATAEKEKPKRVRNRAKPKGKEKEKGQASSESHAEAVPRSGEVEGS